MDNLPSRGFTKLDSGIVDSTLWMKENDVLRVWIALLAKCDAYGLVRAAVPSMAHLCFTTIERFEQIIQELCAPDIHSRSHDNEGRRLQVIEGGWCILNYVRYRDLMQRKAQSHAERQSAYRQRLKERDAIVTGTVTSDAEEEADTEGKSEAKSKKKQQARGARLPADWKPNDAMLAWATAERPDLVMRKAIDSFTDYWHGVAGAKGVKLDWDATFRNWIRDQRGFNGKRPDAAPAGRRMATLTKLEEMKRGLAKTGNHDGLPAADLPLLGSPTRE